MASYSFFVEGKPEPGGSKRIAHWGGIIDANPRVHEWRDLVSATALPVFSQPLQGALSVECVFQLSRPKGHYGKRGRLRLSAPAFPITRPDATKLFRSTEDALTKIAWWDDAQVVKQNIRKVYGSPQGAHITIKPISTRTSPD